jgi:peroxiredoxin
MPRSSARRWYSLFIFLLVVAAAAIGWYWHRQTDDLQRAPQVKLVLLSGEYISLSRWKGKPVLVNFWSTSCEICMEEMPQLIAFYHEFHPQGLEAIGVAMPYDRPDFVTELARDQPIPYPVALDPRGQAVQAFGNVRLTPNTFVFAPDGRLVYHRVGRLDFGKLKQVITQQLKNATASTGAR